MSDTVVGQLLSKMESNNKLESSKDYEVKFRKAGAVKSVKVFSGPLEVAQKFIKDNYPGFKMYEDFGSKSYANGKGQYYAKTSGRGAGEVALLPVDGF